MFEGISGTTDIRGNTRAEYTTDTTVTYVEFITNKTYLEERPLRAVARVQVVSRVFDLRFNLQRAEQHLPKHIVTM